MWLICRLWALTSFKIACITFLRCSRTCLTIIYLSEPQANVLQKSNTPDPEVLRARATSELQNRCDICYLQFLAARSVFAMLCLELLCLLLQVFVVFGTELTFELPDNDKQCFYEELEKDTKFDIDYQVSCSDSFIPVCVCVFTRPYQS